MNTPDDPEARIRDLEQPLSNPGMPPPAQPWPSYPPPGAPPSAGFERKPWVSNLLLALGLLVIVGATAAYLLFGRESAPTDTLSAVSPGGPTVTKTFRSLPTTPGDRSRAPFPTIPPPPTISGDVPADTPPGTKVDVGGIEENKTIACDGNTVTVSGISNTVVITGHCARVVVAGIENVVTVDSADVIEASGIKNRVTFHTGTPKVDVSFDNTVEQG